MTPASSARPGWRRDRPATDHRQQLDPGCGRTLTSSARKLSAASSIFMRLMAGSPVLTAVMGKVDGKLALITGAATMHATIVFIKTQAVANPRRATSIVAL